MTESVLIGLVIASGLALIFILLMLLSCYCSGVCFFKDTRSVGRMSSPPQSMYGYPPPPSRPPPMKVVHPMPIETKGPPGPGIFVPRTSVREPQHAFVKVQL